MEKIIIQGLRDAMEAKLEVALVTVIQITGSTPRKVGARMLVWPDGTTVGTIGGGCGEAEARREALNVISCKQSEKYCLNMSADVAEEEGMVCGGRMDLFIDYFNFLKPDQVSFIQYYIDSMKRFIDPVIITLTECPDKENIGKKLCLNKTQNFTGDLGVEHLNQKMLNNPKVKGSKCVPALINLDAQGDLLEESRQIPVYQVFVDPPQPLVELVILGGGHIALPMASMAKLLGYEVTLIDDRPSFANTNRFFMADKVICDAFEEGLQKIQFTPATYVVIVTRGHRHDKVCLRQVIGKPAGYVGMIGSKRRVKALIADLLEEGISAESLQKLHAPIGLKIGAETPEEIALCILGEIIKVNKGLELQ